MGVFQVFQPVRTGQDGVSASDRNGELLGGQLDSDGRGSRRQNRCRERTPERRAGIRRHRLRGRSGRWRRAFRERGAVWLLDAHRFQTRYEKTRHRMNGARGAFTGFPTEMDRHSSPWTQRPAHHLRAIGGLSRRHLPLEYTIEQIMNKVNFGVSASQREIATAA